MSPAVIAIGLTILALLVAAAVIALRGERRMQLVMPGPWLLLVIVLLVLGLVVAPRLLGIVFLFLPLLWIRRPRSRDRERDRDGEPRERWWDPWDGDRWA